MPKNVVQRMFRTIVGKYLFEGGIVFPQTRVTGNANQSSRKNGGTIAERLVAPKLPQQFDSCLSLNSFQHSQTWWLLNEDKVSWRWQSRKYFAYPFRSISFIFFAESLLFPF